ncbi:MAG: hypothetical protein MJ214_01695 [Bacilli bacterium]|nr:hypothetical protein [Bacilli bacterium]
MKKNKLFIFISSFLFLLTSCGGVAPKGDPVVTFEGLGGTIVSGPETVSVPSGTLWSDISKPYFTRNDTVSLFFTLVQDNIAYTVPNTFPVCADLTVFAYYSDTPYLSNQVVVIGDNIVPTTRSFPKDDFTPMNFGLIYKEGYPKEETTAIYDPNQADVLLSENKLALTVTPKTNDMITVLIGEDENQLVVVFDGNGGTVDGKPYVAVTVDPGTTFGDVTKPEPKRGDEKFACWSFTNDGKYPVSDEYEIIGPTPVYACYEQDMPPVEQPYTITVDGENVTGGEATFPESEDGNFGEYEISYTIDEGYEYSGIEYDPSKAYVDVDDENQIIHVTPNANEDIKIKIETKPIEIYITIHGNGGKTSSGKESVILTVDYGTKFLAIEGRGDFPDFLKDNKSPIGFAFDEVGEQTVSDSYAFKEDKTIYAHYDTLEIKLLDDSMVVYGSTAITYSSLTQISEVTVNPKDAVSCTIDEDTSRIIVDSLDDTANSNITITVKNTADTETCKLSVYHPASLQQASEAVDFALTRQLESFDLTFNYDNQQTEDEFYKNSVETRGCISTLGAQGWHTGSGQTISFKPAYRSNMGTSIHEITEADDNYYKNLKNAAFEMRKVGHVDATSLPIDSIRKTLEVHNSEGLFFALEHGFKPIFKGTDTLTNNASAIYTLAYEACKTTYDSNSKEFNNVRYLYDWLVENTHRDYWIDSTEGPSDKNSYTSYYADGVFRNKGVATSDGFAKAFVIMAGIEGLPIVRTTGTSTSGTHAWNYYRSGDKWYSICPTWSHVDKSKSTDALFGYNFSHNSYQPFMRSRNYFYDDVYDYTYNYLSTSGMPDDDIKAMAIARAEKYNYVEGLFGELNKSTTDYITDKSISSIYQLDTFKVDGQEYSFNIQSTNQVKKLVEALPSSLGNFDFTIDLSYNISQKYYYTLETELKNKFSVADVSYSDNHAGNYKNAELYVLVKHAQ